MKEFDDIIAMFRREAAELLNELARILEAQRGVAGDREALATARRIAHNLRGAALTVGAQWLVDPCHALESEIVAVGTSSEPPGAEQIEIWLRAVTNLQGALDDSKETASMSSALARALTDQPATETATSAGPQFAAAARADSVAQQARESNNDTLPESRTAPGRVLVVDDSLIVRTVEAQILGSAGYEVTACADGEEAWEILNQQQFDLVVCDVQMPNLDGFGLTRRIRASSALHHLPVILATGRSGPDDITRGAQVGADGYIAKGDLVQEELILAVRRLI